MRSMDSLFIPRIIGRLSPVNIVFGLISGSHIKESQKCYLRNGNIECFDRSMLANNSKSLPSILLSAMQIIHQFTKDFKGGGYHNKFDLLDEIGNYC